jgi:hypothetical protein
MQRVLQTLKDAFGVDIFSNPKQFNAALADVPIEEDAKKIRHLLRMAICDLNAYSKLEKAWASGNPFAPGNLAEEMSRDYAMNIADAQVVIWCIAELIGYAPPVQPIPPAAVSAPEPAPASPPQVGDKIKFGRYHWRVLDVQNSRVLVISDEILEKKTYNAQREDTTWEQCSLRAYLNDEFYHGFSSSDQAQIAETTLANHDNPWYGTPGGQDTNDKIFLLSLEEIVQYFGDSGQLSDRPRRNEQRLIDAYYIDDQYNAVRIARGADGSGEFWWLRSPGDSRRESSCILGDGKIFTGGYGIGNGSGGVRPALWLNLALL